MSLQSEPSPFPGLFSVLNFCKFVHTTECSSIRLASFSKVVVKLALSVLQDVIEMLVQKMAWSRSAVENGANNVSAKIENINKNFLNF